MSLSIKVYAFPILRFSVLSFTSMSSFNICLKIFFNYKFYMMSLIPDHLIIIAMWITTAFAVIGKYFN